MANKNRNLIIAYFPGADKADMAADQLKLWDHGNKDVKLGGMAVITYYDGKLHTRKVGAHAGGTGAKWGTILGATGGLLIGIATGGIGLIPGAIAGLGAGGLTGSLFHKKVGLTDADKANLEDHLQSGGAAVAVMADDHEVEPAKAELFNVGGKVQHYQIPDETLAALEAASNAIVDDAPAQPAVGAPAADRVEGVDVGDAHQTAVRASALMAAVRACNAEDTAALQEAGVYTINDLLSRAATAPGRQELSAATGIPAEKILKWANDLDLSRIRGVGVKYADLLESSGVDTVPELAQRNPANLTAKLSEVNAEKSIVVDSPSEKQVSDWVAQAKELPRIITY